MHLTRDYSTRDRLIPYKNSDIFKELHLQYKFEKKMTKRKKSIEQPNFIIKISHVII